MKNFKYTKLYNSQSSTEDIWNKLSKMQQKRLRKIFLKLEKDLLSFKDNKDIAYSLLHHLIDDKIEIIEQELTITQLMAKQIKPFEKFDVIENINGEVKW